ncbi:MAG TPA: hypothetical protein VFT57_04505 [Gemmatimonadaceae bacterium]|jgi:hypothetical protein|nr:hypothetical protein [Gemmatimonadaceae bacterium]
MTLTVYGRDEGGFLLHGNELPIGWVEGRAVGFRGFATRDHALEAARVGHRALQGWLERERHAAPAKSAEGALRTRRDGRLHWITVDGSPVGRLVDPETHAPVSPSTFGFEFLLPPSVNPVGGISAAQVIWHALKRIDGGDLLARLFSARDAGRTAGVQ